VSAVSRVIALETHDVRFPTSLHRDGSDAMNPNPDYAMAYVIVRTDGDDGLDGHGFAFTIGRGNEVAVCAIQALAPLVVGLEVDGLLSDLGGVSRRLTGDSPLRWLGPEKGVMHMASGAVLNALWDMRARREGKPLWRLLAEMEPEEIVDAVDFRYLLDALTPDEALELLRRGRAGSAERAERLLRDGYPAYTTSVGWLGYSDETLSTLCAQAVEQGFEQVKLKVGGLPEDDRRRCRIAREAIGPSVGLALDANQVWDVDEAIERIRALAEYAPAWVEEPTSPDDILGLARVRRAVAPVRLAAGEHTANRVIFKQLLQAQAIDVMQIDACRVAGVNENLANLLLAAKFGVPVCPHAGGAGLCEVVQHLAMFDYVALSGQIDGRMIEWIDHLHEHFADPARVEGGRYLAPTAPGSSAAVLAQSMGDFRFPDGPAWLDGRADPELLTL
jgi:L-fuconate dehydratase